MLNWLLAAVAPGSAFYSAVGGTLTSSDASGALVSATFYYDADGGTRRLQETSGAGSTTDHTNWSSRHPNEATSEWSVRLTFDSGTDVYTSGDGLNTWDLLSSNRSWTFSRTATGPSTAVGNYTFAISRDGGSTVFDSVALTVSLENESP